MQGITDTIKDLSSTAADKLGEAGDYLKANPTLAAMLAAGGGAGLLGGYLTAREPEDEQESKTSRRLRILRNALLAAGAGAGTVGLGSYGLDKLMTAVPEGAPNPVQEKLESPAFRGLGGISGGILGGMAGHKLDLKDLSEQAVKNLSKTEASALLNSDPERLIAYAQKNKNFKGLPSDFLNVNSVKSNNLRKALQIILGGSRAGQLARLGVVGGLAVPEIAGGAKDLFLGGD
jgi:hypothetical protein